MEVKVVHTEEEKWKLAGQENDIIVNVAAINKM